MPELSEQMYCSEQISIPPPFPYLLRQFAKAAIRTQPTDLLKWSTAYFRCLSLNIPPPVKPRLEYPIPRDHCGITPGWLKALLYQLQNNQTVSFKVLWDRWIGACLEHTTLIQILCLGRFDNPEAIPWLRFVSLCAAHLTEDLTHTMTLICEIMTEEPEGGSAMIPVETFSDLYTFLASIDASTPHNVKNLYFTDSLLSLWKEKTEKDESPVVVKEESVYEEESMHSEISEKVESEQSVLVDIKEEISCPSIAGDGDYSMDYYIEETNEEQAESPAFFQDYLEVEGDGHQSQSEIEEVHRSEVKVSDKAIDKDEVKSEEDTGKTSPKKDEAKEAAKEPEERTHPDLNLEAFNALKPVYSSVDTIEEEPRRILPEKIDNEKILLEDLEKLKALQQELQGETDEEMEKFKCQLIEEMPLTESQEQAIKQFEVNEPSEQQISESQEIAEMQEKAESEEEEQLEKPEEKVAFEDVFIDAVPGIGPTVPDNLVKAVCDYMRSVSTIQHGMVMPRNIRHYNCPPLELLEY